MENKILKIIVNLIGSLLLAITFVILHYIGLWKLGVLMLIGLVFWIIGDNL